MEDITPLNLEDAPKLFGLRYDQLIAILVCLILSTQLYSWMNPVMIGTQDLRLHLAILIGIMGPVYCLVTLNHSGNYWESILNFYVSSQVYIPGPDPNPIRFLSDEQLLEFSE
ncbi:MAG TPA: hypothetical protein V6D17_22875 [Candidatus Obscuribacterales bacterium]